MEQKFKQFNKQSYLNLETLRKSGEGVKTPVWFVQDGENIYVRTMKNSWKIKRVRNNSLVRIAPCDNRGGLKGEWENANATVVEGASSNKAEKLLKKKYGLMKTMMELRSKIQKLEYATIEITPAS